MTVAITHTLLREFSKIPPQSGSSFIQVSLKIVQPKQQKEGLSLLLLLSHSFNNRAKSLRRSGSIFNSLKCSSSSRSLIFSPLRPKLINCSSRQRVYCAGFFLSACSSTDQLYIR